MYQQEDLLPTNRNYVFLIGCFTIFFTITIIGFLLLSSRTNEISQNDNITFRPDATRPQADLTKYNQDSDNDLIPNFVEEDAILNTYLSETSYCEQANPLCSTNPLNEEYFISIILDSSTSMGIPATQRQSKLELVKENITNFLVNTFDEEYLKIQIVGSGNKGNLNFIADNESCVSNFSFKNYNQKLLSKASSSIVLNSLYANGKSPIGYTLEQVEKNFPNKDAKNLVIIITDGIDDCGYDLNTTFRGVLERGTVKKINLVSLYSPQDENIKLREATESNGGKFTNSENIFETINNWKQEFILENWCKYTGQQKVQQCLDNNYNNAFSYLDELVTPETPQNEISKIREIKSSADLYLQNYRSQKIQSIEEEFKLILENNKKNR